jgi:hypothetical protein
VFLLKNAFMHNSMACMKIEGHVKVRGCFGLTHNSMACMKIEGHVKVAKVNEFMFFCKVCCDPLRGPTAIRVFKSSFGLEPLLNEIK